MTVNRKRQIAGTLGTLALVGCLALAPQPALAADGNTGTTEVTIVGGADWGQSKKEVDVAGGPKGRAPQTGDSSPWIPVALAGGAALCAGGLVCARRRAMTEQDLERGGTDEA